MSPVAARPTAGTGPRAAASRRRRGAGRGTAPQAASPGQHRPGPGCRVSWGCGSTRVQDGAGCEVVCGTLPSWAPAAPAHGSAIWQIQPSHGQSGSGSRKRGPGPVGATRASSKPQSPGTAHCTPATTPPACWVPWPGPHQPRPRPGLPRRDPEPRGPLTGVRLPLPSEEPLPLGSHRPARPRGYPHPQLPPGPLDTTQVGNHQGRPAPSFLDKNQTGIAAPRRNRARPPLSPPSRPPGPPRPGPGPGGARRAQGECGAAPWARVSASLAARKPLATDHLSA